ncbi:unnamed protein product [Mesocestoides corti]|uniref:Hexosyltransferase n=1 Tax=Mesocestoides corti TaxID=53468 RepID=A0A3P6GHE3_MESCO|nr:unnamed protein product [Mesocestoides corti]
MNQLNNLTKSDRRQLLSGNLMIRPGVIRPVKDGSGNKWAVSRYEVPWSQYSPYPSGAATFVGADVLTELVVAEAYTRFLYVDDAFMGFAVAKLPHLRFHSLKDFYLKSTNSQKSLIAKSPVRF